MINSDDNTFGIEFDETPLTEDPADDPELIIVHLASPHLLRLTADQWIAGIERRPENHHRHGRYVVAAIQQLGLDHRLSDYPALQGDDNPMITEIALTPTRLLPASRLRIVSWKNPPPVEA